MIGYVMVGTNNLDAAIKFYDEVLEVIGLSRNETVENDYAAYGKYLSFHMQHNHFLQFRFLIIR